MTLLTTKLGLEEALGTLWMTFTGRELPPGRTLHALIPSRPATRITAQITFDATAPVAIVAGKRREEHNENVNFADLPTHYE